MLSMSSPVKTTHQLFESPVKMEDFAPSSPLYAGTARFVASSPIPMPLALPEWFESTSFSPMAPVPLTEEERYQLEYPPNVKRPWESMAEARRRRSEHFAKRQQRLFFPAAAAAARVVADPTRDDESTIYDEDASTEDASTEYEDEDALMAPVASKPNVRYTFDTISDDHRACDVCALGLTFFKDQHPLDLEDRHDVAGSVIQSVSSVSDLTAAQNELVFCEGESLDEHGAVRPCNVLVHQCCYGIRSVPKGKWLCDACQARGTLVGKQERFVWKGTPEIQCAYCPYANGPLKRLRYSHPEDRDRNVEDWIHVTCAQYLPNVHLEGVGLDMDVAVTSRRLPLVKELQCTFCEREAAPEQLISCPRIRCEKRYHPLCVRFLSTGRARRGALIAKMDVHGTNEFCYYSGCQDDARLLDEETKKYTRVGKSHAQLLMEESDRVAVDATIPRTAARRAMIKRVGQRPNHALSIPTAAQVEQAQQQPVPPVRVVRQVRAPRTLNHSQPHDFRPTLADIIPIPHTNQSMFQALFVGLKPLRLVPATETYAEFRQKVVMVIAHFDTDAPYGPYGQSVRSYFQRRWNLSSNEEIMTYLLAMKDQRPGTDLELWATSVLFHDQGLAIQVYSGNDTPLTLDQEWKVGATRGVVRLYQSDGHFDALPFSLPEK